MQLPPTTAPNEFLFCDIRQQDNYQMASGNAALLSGSRIYHYKSDRCLVAEEHYYFQGWGRETVFTGVTQELGGNAASSKAEDGPPAAKRRRGKSAKYQPKIVDLAGNAMSLPDLAQLYLPLLFSLNADMFAEECPYEDCPFLFGNTSGCKYSEVDLAMNNGQLKKAHSTGSDINSVFDYDGDEDEVDII